MHWLPLISDKILWTLRNCALCGASWPPKKWLCRSCDQALHGRILEPGAMRWEEIKSLEVYSLLDWRRSSEEGLFLSRLMYSLKGEFRQDGWDLMALRFLSQWTLVKEKSSPVRDSLQKGTVLLVPAPPRLPGQRDHATAFAQGLSEYLDAPIYLGLRKKIPQGSWVQKQLGRGQRARLEVEHQGSPPSYLTKEWTVIFVDDLITTGATARAVAAAFRKTECQFVVWTLARRSLD